MAGETNILKRVRESAARQALFLPHAIRQMSRPDRQITSDEVLEVIQEGEVAEDYPEDARGHSCLLLGYGEGGRAIHVVCSPKEDYLAIITAYLPDPDVWESDYRTRKRR
ncbi:MAG: DUF4258 domain-containing protein [Planctomycetota bacterium]